MKLLNYLLFVMLLFFSCQNRNNENKVQLLTFNLNKSLKTTSVKLSDLGFIKIIYIPLETDEKSQISRITELKAESEFYIVKYFNNILKFNSKGSFATKIGIEGRGPNEFIVAHDVEIDRRRRQIYLVDGWAKRFYVYSENGVFNRTFQSPMNTINFELLDDQVLCFSTNYIGNIESSYNLIDTNGRILKAYLNKYPWQYKVQQGTAIFEENLFYEFNDRIFSKEVYSDTVFMFERGTFVPHIIIDQGDKLLTTKARSIFNPGYLFENYFSQKTLFEFGDYIYYEFAIGPKLQYNHYGLIGSKKTKSEYLILADQGLFNDLDGGPNILPRTIMDDNTIVAWVDALQLIKHVTSDGFRKSTPKYPEKKKELERLVNNLKETDNPILILVKLKEY